VALTSQAQDSAGLTTTSPAYAIGDTLGSGWTFTSMASGSGGGGIIRGVACKDDSDVMEGMLLWLSKASVTFGTDNAGPSISDSDAAHLVCGPIPLTFYDLGGVRFGSMATLSEPYMCDVTSLFAYATTLSTNAVFGATGALRLRLFYEVLS
jgi:hypothetical protein